MLAGLSEIKEFEEKYKVNFLDWVNDILNGNIQM